MVIWSKIEVLFLNLRPLSKVVSTNNLLGSTFFLWNCWFILVSFCISERHKSAVFWYLFLCSTRQSTPLFKHSTFSRQIARNSCKPVCIHSAEKEVCEVKFKNKPHLDSPVFPRRRESFPFVDLQKFYIMFPVFLWPTVLTKFFFMVFTKVSQLTVVLLAKTQLIRTLQQISKPIRRGDVYRQYLQD